MTETFSLAILTLSKPDPSSSHILPNKDRNVGNCHIMHKIARNEKKTPQIDVYMLFEAYNQF